MCQLLCESERLPSVSPDARTLSRFVERALGWVQEAHDFLFVQFPVDSPNANGTLPSADRRLSYRTYHTHTSMPPPVTSTGHPAPASDASNSGPRIGHADAPTSPTALNEVSTSPLPPADTDDQALAHLGSLSQFRPGQPLSSSHSLEQLEALLLRGDQLQFDAPEIRYLQRLRHDALTFRHQAQATVNRLGQLYLYQPPEPIFKLSKAGDLGKLTQLQTEIAHLDHVLAQGENVPVYLPELVDLQAIRGELAWSLRAQTLLTRAATALHEDKGALRARWFDSEDKLSLDEFLQLLEDAVESAIPGENAVFVALRDAKRLGDDWSKDVSSFFHKAEVTLSEVADELDQGFFMLPYTPPVFVDLQTMGRQFAELDQRATGLVVRMKQPDVTKRPLVSELKSTLEQFDNLYLHPPVFRPPAVSQLKDAMAMIDSWILRGKKLFARGNMPKKWVEMLLEVEEAVNRCTAYAPSLAVAYKVGLGDLGANNLLQQSAKGRPRPLLSSLTHDPEPWDSVAATKVKGRRHGNSKRDGPPLYCVCRQPEQGFMVECDICHEWYHGGCLKLSRRETKAQSYFVCPLCDPFHMEMPHPTKRPSLDTLIAHAREGEKLPVVTLELDPLVTIILAISKFRDLVHDALALHRLVTIPNVSFASTDDDPALSPSAKTPTLPGLLALDQALLRCGEGTEVSLPYEELELRTLMMHLRAELGSHDTIAQEWLRSVLPNERARIKQQLDHERRQQQHVRLSSPRLRASGSGRGWGRSRESAKSQGHGSGPGTNGSSAPDDPNIVMAGQYRIRVLTMVFDDPTAVRHCLCQQPFDATQAMIACNTCHRWFHLTCAVVPILSACTLDTYKCPVCSVRERVPYAFGDIRVVDETSASSSSGGGTNDDGSSSSESDLLTTAHHTAFAPPSMPASMGQAIAQQSPAPGPTSRSPLPPMEPPSSSYLSPPSHALTSDGVTFDSPDLMGELPDMFGGENGGHNGGGDEMSLRLIDGQANHESLPSPHAPVAHSMNVDDTTTKPNDEHPTQDGSGLGDCEDQPTMAATFDTPTTADHATFDPTTSPNHHATSTPAHSHSPPKSPTAPSSLPVGLPLSQDSLSSAAPQPLALGLSPHSDQTDSPSPSPARQLE
ncbi:hypothetical protein H4R35_001377 [Dimargaris xerosporica]|nr:hypothetical protein H4R35_001377 [Dimargaris xerosporica]